ncbi:hypothetical protein GUJ93_ZPchr0009g945 [Zizania palustris]|uniref:Pectinesterase catalytic domain-containing protein n=1 Tax=Zizania palustris TaxID=103762 RepID=A0A8J5R953_ZIZPA|nr:hypothetical protein GUJ93_ZPchr0009g945 [Zizania palustris]
MPKSGQKLDAKRRLLLVSPSSLEFKPNVTVIADGSGNFKTINEALAKVPLMSTSTYMMSVMMNITTKNTATMEVIGNGFFMRGIRLENTARAKNYQAVALRVGNEKMSKLSGKVIHNYTIEPHPKFKAYANKFHTFLNRPWKAYSRTLYIQSDIGSFIDPQGWMPWVGEFGLNTCYYVEVENHGVGADMSKHVKWKDVKIVTYQQAQLQYTIETFIQGQE